MKKNYTSRYLKAKEFTDPYYKSPTEKVKIIENWRNAIQLLSNDNKYPDGDAALKTIHGKTLTLSSVTNNLFRIIYSPKYLKKVEKDIVKYINEMKKTKKLVDGNSYDLDGVKRSIQIIVNNAVNRYNQYALNKRDEKKGSKFINYGTMGGGKCFGKLCPSKQHMPLLNDGLQQNYSTLNDDEIIRFPSNDSDSSDEAVMDWDAYSKGIKFNISNDGSFEQVYREYPGRQTFDKPLADVEMSDNIGSSNPILRWFSNLRKKKIKKKKQQKTHFNVGDIIKTNKITGLQPDDSPWKSEDNNVYYYVFNSEANFDEGDFVDKIGKYQEHIQVYPYEYHYSTQGRQNKVNPNILQNIRAVFDKNIGQSYYQKIDKSTSLTFKRFKKEWLDSGKIMKLTPGGILKGGKRRRTRRKRKSKIKKRKTRRRTRRRRKTRRKRYK